MSNRYINPVDTKTTATAKSLPLSGIVVVNEKTDFMPLIEDGQDSKPQSIVTPASSSKKLIRPIKSKKEEINESGQVNGNQDSPGNPVNEPSNKVEIPVPVVEKPKKVPDKKVEGKIPNVEFTESPFHFYQLMTTKGFRVNKAMSGLGDNPVLVNETDNRVRPSGKYELAKAAMDHIDKLELGDNRSEVVNVMAKHLKAFIHDFNFPRLPTLESDDFLRDKRDTSYFFFQNQIVRVRPDGIETDDYLHQEKVIWESEVIGRDCHLVDHDEVVNNCEFYKFLQNVTSHPDQAIHEQRFKRLMSLIGYLIHRYRDPSCSKAIILMDGILDGNPNGGTGKGILVRAVEKIRKTTIEDGKHMPLNNWFAFQMLTPDTKVYAMEDVVRDFNFESLFSLITEGAVVEKKRKDKIRIPFEDSPKVVITTNYAIKGSGDSFKRRREEFDLSTYYSSKKRPIDEFGHFFFDDWDAEQYNLFDNLMLTACKSYLAYGFLEAPSEYIFEKKLLAHIQPELVDFVKSEVAINTTYYTNDLYIKFINQHGKGDGITQRYFSNSIKKFAELSELKYEVGHTGEKRYFALRA
jgi:hypothetical protein